MNTRPEPAWLADRRSESLAALAHSDHVEQVHEPERAGRDEPDWLAAPRSEAAAALALGTAR